MNKNVTVKIDKKKIVKKLEKIALEKYQSTYTPSEHNEDGIQHSPFPMQYIPLENSTFVSANKNKPYGIPKEVVPSGYLKTKCTHCYSVITIPLGYSNCPECGKAVYADKDTTSLM